MSPEEIMAMAPPEVAGPDEKILSAEGVSNLDLQAQWPRNYAKDCNADLSTEIVSLSQKFGHIFRYKRWDRDGPEVRDDGTLILCSPDCEQFMIVTYPAPFKLPG